jgi:L-fuculose-phosphate aldolase
MAAEGLVKGSEGNVSVREGELVHITPAGLAYEEMGADDVVTLGLAGERVGGERDPSSERAVHLAIYAARPDVRAIVHTHGPAATASATVAPVAEFAPSGSAELGTNVVAALGAGDSVVMARHGVVAVGATLGAALEVARRVENAAL